MPSCAVRSSCACCCSTVSSSGGCAGAGRPGAGAGTNSTNNAGPASRPPAAAAQRLSAGLLCVSCTRCSCQGVPGRAGFATARPAGAGISGLDATRTSRPPLSMWSSTCHFQGRSGWLAYCRVAFNSRRSSSLSGYAGGSARHPGWPETPRRARRMRARCQAFAAIRVPAPAKSILMTTSPSV